MATADLTRQRLVRAALELFTSQGYHVTTTVQIARKAGVAEGTIYKHFESKQHLLNELYRGAARWAARAAEEADATPGTVRDRLQLCPDEGLNVDGAVEWATSMAERLAPHIRDAQPMIGLPSPAAAWTRIWCVLPVSGSKRTRTRSISRATTHHLVRAGRPCT